MRRSWKSKPKLPSNTKEALRQAEIEKLKRVQKFDRESYRVRPMRLPGDEPPYRTASEAWFLVNTAIDRAARMARKVTAECHALRECLYANFEAGIHPSQALRRAQLTDWGRAPKMKKLVTAAIRAIEPRFRPVKSIESAKKAWNSYGADDEPLDRHEPDGFRDVDALEIYVNKLAELIRAKSDRRTFLEKFCEVDTWKGAREALESEFGWNSVRISNAERGVRDNVHTTNKRLREETNFQRAQLEAKIAGYSEAGIDPSEDPTANRLPRRNMGRNEVSRLIRSHAESCNPLVKERMHIGRGSPLAYRHSDIDENVPFAEIRLDRVRSDWYPHHEVDTLRAHYWSDGRCLCFWKDLITPKPKRRRIARKDMPREGDFLARFDQNQASERRDYERRREPESANPNIEAYFAINNNPSEAPNSAPLAAAQ